MVWKGPARGHALRGFLTDAASLLGGVLRIPAGMRKAGPCARPYGWEMSFTTKTVWSWR